MDIKHLLCPVDFSDISQHALDHAAAIAQWYQSRLTVLYVFVNPSTMDLPPLVFEDTDRERLTASMRKMAAGVPRDASRRAPARRWRGPSASLRRLMPT